MHAAWRPLPETGLTPRQGAFVQLTGSFSAPCNLDTYAGTLNGRPQYVKYDVLK